MGGACRPAWRIGLLSAVLGSTLAIAAPVLAQAQGRLEARYTATLAGIPIGKGAWTVEIREHQYSAVADGRVTGLMRAITRGDGTAVVWCRRPMWRIPATITAVPRCA